MIALDISLLPRHVVTVLQLRGRELPPLRMQDGANRAAKSILESIPTDAELLHRKELAGEAMAGAVRAMLYLWNGWLDDCKMFVQGAPEPERLLLAGICERQLGRTREAKASLQKVKAHPIFRALDAYALEAIGRTGDTALHRFKQLLEMVEEWEPFAFIDLYEQASAERLSGSAIHVVRRLQCREYELLYVHCYEAAVGERLHERRREDGDGATDRLRQLKRRRAPSTKHRRQPAGGAQAATAVEPHLPSTLTVRCPKCQAPGTAPDASRGKATRRAACGAKFLVPSGKRDWLEGPAGGLRPTAGPTPTVGVRCPACRVTMVLPASARGKRKTCASCGVPFLVPK